MAKTFTSLVVFVHRWIGICLSLFFAMWFFTGIVMMYVPFPSLADADRLDFLEHVDTRSFIVTPGEAVELCDKARVDRLRIITSAQRPLYVCYSSEGQIQTAFADENRRATPLSHAQALQIATSALHERVMVGDPIEYDQWVVHQKFDSYRPFYKVEVGDVADTHLYLSSQTGEFLQRTTGHARFWNYLGAVAHWIYPTVLRKHWAWWDQTVWWLSLFGIVGVTIGLYLGVLHLIEVQRARKSLLSPFTGWMRWHHLLGLFSGLFVLSWVFSGWLSMDHGRLFSVPNATPEQIRTIQGRSLNDIGNVITLDDLASFQNVKELSFHNFGGAEIIVAKNENGYVNTRMLDPGKLARIVAAAWPRASILRYGIVPSGDTYTDLREGRLSPGTVRIELDDSQATWVHVNPYSGEIASVIDRGRRAYRWLFNGLHSLDIPGLVDRKPIWELVMLSLLVLGLISSLTSVVIGAKRIVAQIKKRPTRRAL